jgi:5-hydroxyisourate hydrolase
MVRLTTHVLDTAQGKPAAGVLVRLLRYTDRDEGGWRGAHQVSHGVTNADGRLDAPLLDGVGSTGTWELQFAIGAYFAAQGIEAGEPPFLDDVIVRFSISDDEDHYHVPLLVSPWSYTTYRGS